MAEPDRIIIKNFKLSVRVGVLDWEQALDQKLVLNMVLYCDLRAAGKHDDLNESVDYKQVADRVASFCGEANYQLLETYAEKIAGLILSEFPVKKVQIELLKPCITAAIGEVGVVIERSQPDAE